LDIVTAMAFIQRRTVMNKQIETNETVELGSVSADTKGGVFTKLDNEGSLAIPAGLADD